MGNLTIWLTPIWIVSLGVTAAAAAMLILYGIVWLVSRRTAEAALRLERESVLQWISYMVLVFVGFSLLAAPVMPARQVLNSLKRLPAVGPYSTKVSIPAHTDDLEVPVQFESDE
jgi:cytochrome bd-type quinol oxidase subunit 2